MVYFVRKRSPLPRKLACADITNTCILKRGIKRFDIVSWRTCLLVSQK